MLTRCEFSADLGGLSSFLWLATAVTIGLGVVHMLLVGLGGLDPHDTGMRFLSFDAEQTFISYYSSSLLLLAALGTLGVGLCHRTARSPQARYWLLLSAVLLYMSLDEAVSLHEFLGQALQRRGLAPASLDFASWVVFAIPLVVAVGLLFLRFLRMIDRTLALRFVLAGLVYLGGSIGLELVANTIIAQQAHIDVYRLATVVEESAELLGITLYAATILIHLRLAASTSAA